MMVHGSLANLIKIFQLKIGSEAITVRSSANYLWHIGGLCMYLFVPIVIERALLSL